MSTQVRLLLENYPALFLAMEIKGTSTTDRLVS